jgi:hypothetical protein
MRKTVSRIITSPEVVLAFGVWMVCWFFAEAAVDIHAHRAIWQIGVSVVFILLGLTLVVHGRREWSRSRNSQ